MWNTYCSIPVPLLNIIKICLRVSKLWNARFWLQGRWLHNGEESESCLSCMRHTYWSSSSSLPNIIILSQTVWELWPAQDFLFRGDNYIRKKVRVVSCMVHASSSFLLNIIKICLSVSKLWSTQDFGFRGGNYIIKKVRVVSLACDMPTGPPLHFYKTAKYVLGYVMECTRF